MEGKVCLVTGATAGIGLATALGLARQGATVLLVGRNRARGEAAVARILDETGSPPRSEVKARYFCADLSVQAGVRRLAREVQAVYPRLDVLINNAGAFFHQRQKSTDGIEMTWALNVLAPFLLTRLLVEGLTDGAPGRVLFVSSFVQRWARMHFDDLQGERSYNRMRAYSQSKLAAVLLSCEFARRLQDKGITANALEPGFVSTGIIGGHGGWTWKLLQSLSNLAALSPARGAQTSLYVASSPDVATTTGRFFGRNSRAAAPSPAACDPVAAQRLWRVCMEMTGEAASG